ncbi:type II toxin-antitoxin system VapC family toxin [candidate division KSB1 bacterium]|nr:type II toxin-antitoxin system VapC family toxin [candidate division KSB1 bacterium]
MDDHILVDTDILIDVSRQENTAIKRLINEEKRSNLAISVITQMELIVGCRNKAELRILSSFLSRFTILLLNESISELGIALLKQYRLSHGLLIADCLIAATAVNYSIPLLTKN